MAFPQHNPPKKKLNVKIIGGGWDLANKAQGLEQLISYENVYAGSRSKFYSNINQGVDFTIGYCAFQWAMILHRIGRKQEYQCYWITLCVDPSNEVATLENTT